MTTGLTVSEWDCRAEFEVGLLITEYLDRNAPPDGSLLAGDLVDWAWRLRHDGEARLKALKALAGGDA